MYNTSKINTTHTHTHTHTHIHTFLYTTLSVPIITTHEGKSFHTQSVTEYTLTCVMVIVVSMQVISFPVHEMDPAFLPLLEVSLELAF